MVHSEPDGPARLQTQKGSGDALLVFRPWSLLAPATAGLLKALPFPGTLYHYRGEQLFGENS